MIDFCVTINGTNLDCFVPLFFETLFKTNDVSQLHFHVVCKEDVEQKVRDYLATLKDRYPGRFDTHDLPFLPDKLGPGKEHQWFASDCAFTCEWMLENCGASEWAIISHFDLVMSGDLVTELISRMSLEMAIVGEHRRGMVAINRKAYGQRFVGFNSMSYFYAQKMPTQNAYKLRHGSDPRCTSEDIRIEGFDVMELFELNMRAKQWHVDSLSREFYQEYCWHIAAGSGYHNNPVTAQSQREQVTRKLNQHQIEGL